jgi:hypothetical protein
MHGVLKAHMTWTSLISEGSKELIYENTEDLIWELQKTPKNWKTQKMGWCPSNTLGLMCSWYWGADIEAHLSRTASSHSLFSLVLQEQREKRTSFPCCSYLSMALKISTAANNKQWPRLPPQQISTLKQNWLRGSCYILSVKEELSDNSQLHNPSPAILPIHRLFKGVLCP